MNRNIGCVSRSGRTGGLAWRSHPPDHVSRLTRCSCGWRIADARGRRRRPTTPEHCGGIVCRAGTRRLRRAAADRRARSRVGPALTREAGVSGTRAGTGPARSGSVDGRNVSRHGGPAERWRGVADDERAASMGVDVGPANITAVDVPVVRIAGAARPSRRATDRSVRRSIPRARIRWRLCCPTPAGTSSRSPARTPRTPTPDPRYARGSRTTGRLKSPNAHNDASARPTRPSRSTSTRTRDSSPTGHRSRVATRRSPSDTTRTRRTRHAARSRSDRTSRNSTRTVSGRYWAEAPFRSARRASDHRSKSSHAAEL